MRYRDLLASSFTAPLCLALTACGSGEAPVASMRETESPTQALEFTSTFPDGLVVVGDGYPQSGNACRRLGESKATADWLDDSAVLIGCPTEISAEGLGGEIVGNVAGISIVSWPCFL